MTLRLNGSTSGYSEIDAPAIAGDQVFTLPTTGGTLDRINRAGNILQVVNAAYSTVVTTSSVAFGDTGLTATITPTSATSKILVLVSQAGCGKVGSGYGEFRLLRGGTEVVIFDRAVAYDNSAGDNRIGACGCSFMDAPATTSATTYKTQIKNPAGAGTAIVQDSNCTSTITLIEVAA
jgi:hypothetical protein